MGQKERIPMGQEKNNSMGQNKRKTMGQKTNLQMDKKTNPKNGSTTIELQLQPLWRILFTKSLPKINGKTKI